MNKFVKNTLILSISYLLIFSAIIRANVLYVDDVHRAYTGVKGWGDFGRYIDNWLSGFIHGSNYLADVSPLTQYIAIVFLALAGGILIHVFLEDKLNVWTGAAVLILGINPLFLECFVFKYDSPYMALSVLASIAPIYFIEKGEKPFIIASVIGTLVMCLTYQASNGIYPLLVIFYLFIFANKFDDRKKRLRYIVTCIFCYALPLGLFYLYTKLFTSGYVDTSIVSDQSFIARTKEHFEGYFIQLYVYFKKPWLLFMAAIVAGFVVTVAAFEKEKRLQKILMSLVVILVSVFACMGVYPYLAEAQYSPRAMYGIFFPIVMMAVYIARKNDKYVFRTCTALACCAFISFAFVYGNALDEQQRWTEFRAELIIDDLNDVNALDTEKQVQLSGTIGFAPNVANELPYYPLLQVIVPDNLSSVGAWTENYFYNYFGLTNAVQNREGYENYVDMSALDLPILVDNNYHTIRGNDEYVLIELK